MKQIVYWIETREECNLNGWCDTYVDYVSYSKEKIEQLMNTHLFKDKRYWDTKFTHKLKSKKVEIVRHNKKDYALIEVLGQLEEHHIW